MPWRTKPGQDAGWATELKASKIPCVSNGKKNKSLLFVIDISTGHYKGVNLCVKEKKKDVKISHFSDLPS